MTSSDLNRHEFAFVKCQCVNREKFVIQQASLWRQWCRLVKGPWSSSSATGGFDGTTNAQGWLLLAAEKDSCSSHKEVGQQWQVCLNNVEKMRPTLRTWWPLFPPAAAPATPQEEEVRIVILYVNTQLFHFMLDRQM